jgi:hypothetical protein
MGRMIQPKEKNGSDRRREGKLSEPIRRIDATERLERAMAPDDKTAIILVL